MFLGLHGVVLPTYFTLTDTKRSLLNTNPQKQWQKTGSLASSWVSSIAFALHV